ncbi:mitochondrial processing peptidase [Mycena floridula]|nr:mitochondrial processing peptidase [Mycena floridula]
MRKASYSVARNALRTSKRRLHNSSIISPVQVTTLPNRIRVATDSTPGHFSSVGLYIDAGVRYETPETSGVSHFLERLAFKSTNSRTEEKMIESIENSGAQMMCSSSRETILYQSSHSNEDTPLAMSLIADTALNASFKEEEVDAHRDAAFYELREASSKPETNLPEIFHGVAYNHQGLGNPTMCPMERIDVINGPLLKHAIAQWYRPERMVIAGTGMRHEELVELSDKLFSSVKPTQTSPRPSHSHSSTPNPLLSATTPSISKTLTRAASYLFPQSLSPTSSVLSRSSTYTGGHKFISDKESEFNHLYVGYEGVGVLDEDIYALATMQVLLGGGGSFSAGGPGKGMYSRLYTHILNYFPHVDHCASFHHIYADSSLFGLFASFVPSTGFPRNGNTATQILPHLLHQLSLLLYTPIPAQELDRAKNQLKSSLMMALESRSVQVEDLGRQMLVYDRLVSSQEMAAKIDSVTPNDVQRVAARVFGPSSGNTPTIVCSGHEDVRDCRENLKKYGLSYGAE